MNVLSIAPRLRPHLFALSQIFQLDILDYDWHQCQTMHLVDPDFLCAFDMCLVDIDSLSQHTMGVVAHAFLRQVQVICIYSDQTAVDVFRSRVAQLDQTLLHFYKYCPETIEQTLASELWERVAEKQFFPVP